MYGCCGGLSQALDGFPDALRRHLPIGELGDGLDPGQAIPNFNQPLVVGANQLGEFHLVGEAGMPVSRAALREA